jgi:Domain of unknown function (DUF4347)/RTX calcium-binding nonapeptide repeat (4 copies)/Bacterial Ig domain
MNTFATANSLVSAGAAFTSAVKTPSSLVVFDGRLSDLDVLYGALLPSAIGHTIDATEDALVVITRLLAETGAKSLAIVAHGKPGIIHLGRESIDLEVLSVRSGLLQEWCVDEISLYSCEVGADVGFVGKLEQVTGARVAASARKVGAENLGGSWELEGNPDASALWSSTRLMSYSSLLADVTATTGLDNFNGTVGTTSGNDKITINATNKLNSGDTLQGGGGNDTIDITVGGGFDFAGAGTVADPGVDITGIEILTSSSLVNQNQNVTLTGGQFNGLTSIDLGLGNDSITINNFSGTFNPTKISNVEKITLVGTAGNDTIVGSLLAETINGGNGADSINGGAGADSINGGAGDDTINGGAGDDTINGGGGADTVKYLGNRADYTISFVSGTTYTVVDNRSIPTDGTDTVTNVTNFQFADNSFTTGTLDFTAPNTPTISTVAVDDKVNSSEKSVGVTISGTAEANSSVTIVWGTTTVTATTNAGGNWSKAFTDAQIPADGSSSISVTAKDAQGNTSAAATKTVEIDTVAPTAPSITSVVDDHQSQELY